MRMTAMLGYARVSTIGQDLDAQLAALDAAGVDPSRVFTDKLSGSAKTARPGLVALLDYARPGDTVVVAAIDRLGRSVAEVTRTIADLGERRITLYVLREGVDTATPTGRAIAAIMASLAELGLELGRERRAASRESRRARICRPPNPPAQVVQIYIAISASAASGRVERLQRAAPGPSSGVVPAAPFVGPNGRRLRSAWHPVAIMRRRGRVHGRRLKLRVRRPWLVVELERGRDEQAATRRGAPFQPALEQRPDPGLTARGLEGGVAHFGSKKCPQRPPRLCEALQNH